MGSYCSWRSELQLVKMRRALGMDGGDGCTTLRKLFTATESYTLGS